MITYRDAGPGDGAVLGGIARATFIETFGSLYSIANLDAFLASGTDAAYGAELADPEIAVHFALSGGNPVGFCKIGRLKLPAETREPAMELRQLYIFRPWQGVGIADVLTRWALDTARARGAHEIWLSVFTENPRARRFYARHGFVEIAPYRFMVGDQADEDVLCRAIL
ncbi:GNAT family N-acetyltransferase [Sandarakinorhabdus sp. DWP1-3-1]|uniref:GNAT family N-acetyltransferase n=1 Tax=Sandarakinorhabdus sp. DWP1-3-1 TaxID=2804627 RepID=UPI003CF842CB